MIRLESARLYLLPLTWEQLVKYTKLGGSLESELGLQQYPRKLPEELKEAFEQTILPAVKADPDNILFSTLWTMIDKEKNLMVGDLCFKGPPNKEGEVEIGYGIYEDFANKGYMTEAIACLKIWALSQPDVTCILAETGMDNWASHSTLMKTGFSRFRETGDMLWWRTTRPVNL